MRYHFILISAKAIAIILHRIVKTNVLLDSGQDQTLNKLGSFANGPDNLSVPVRKKIPSHLEYFYVNILKRNSLTILLLQSDEGFSFTTSS